MLADIRRGDEHLGERDGVVRQEEEREIGFRVRILVDHAGDVDDQADGLVGDR